MATPHLRPVFTVEVPLDPDVVLNRVRAGLTGPRTEWGMVGGRSFDLFVDREAEHFWSPHLTVQVEATSAGTTLYGRFAPKPAVWTLFVFLYAAAAFAGMIGAAWGFAQWAMSSPPWALWSIPASALFIGVLYWASSVGQRLGSGQMELLRKRLDTLVDQDPVEHPKVV